MKITLRNQQNKIRLNLPLLKNQIRKILLWLNCAKNSELSVVFVNDAKIRSLNKKYLKRNNPTDVLAFGPLTPKELGDVVISVETAKRNTRKFKTTFHKELSLYIIHGILHLLGYDDIKNSDRIKMQAKEKELLERLYGTFKN